MSQYKPKYQQPMNEGHFIEFEEENDDAVDFLVGESKNGEYAH